MKILGLFIFFLIPTAYSAPSCGELGRIIQEFETDLQRSALSDCKNKEKEFETTYLKDNRCLDLGVIWAREEKLKNELTVLIGIEKLKAAIESSKIAAANGSIPAGEKFVTSLHTAEALELLIKKPDLIKELKKESSLTDSSLKNSVTKLCKDEKKDEINACNPTIFSLTPEASRELVALINNNDPTEQEIKKWQDQLAIKRKNSQDNEDEQAQNSDYSFHQMRRELQSSFDKIDKKEIMGREHLNAIKKLDDFETAKGFSFVENIAGLKDKNKAKILFDQLLTLMGDAKLRVEFDTQNKISVAYQSYKDKIKLGEKEAISCQNSKDSFEDVMSCHEALKKAQKDLGQEDLKSLLNATESSINYADKLTQVALECKNQYEKNQTIPQDCFSTISKDMKALQDEMLELNKLKEKIAEENEDKLLFRQFALEKWHQAGCGSRTSLMDQCDESDSAVSKEAFLLAGTGMDIAVLFAPQSETEEKVSEICEDEQKKKRTRYEALLCETFSSDETSPIVTDNSPKDPDGPTAAPDGGHQKAAIRDAWLGGLGNLLGTGLNGYLASKFNQVNNYPLNPSPFLSGPNRPTSSYPPSFGSYTPTPGYQPFAMGPGISSYFGR